MQQTHEVMREMHCFTYESARVGEEDGAFPGDFLGDLGLGVSRETLPQKLALMGLIDTHSDRHSLNPTVRSPSPAASRIARCSSVSTRVKLTVS
jgi:hypothetical protein